LDEDTAVRATNKSASRHHKHFRRGDLTERLIKILLPLAEPARDFRRTLPRPMALRVGGFFSFARLHAKESGLLSYGPYQQMII
jgi:hypothetical protein